MYYQFIIIINSFERFSYQCYLIGSHWSLSDSKSAQVSRTLLSILTDLNNHIVRMVSTHPLISKSSCHCTTFVMTVASATIGIKVTFLFHCLFRSLAKSKNLCFTLGSAGTLKFTIRQIIIIIAIIFFTSYEFFTSVSAGGFYRNLSDSNIFQVSRIFLSMWCEQFRFLV